MRPRPAGGASELRCARSGLASLSLRPAISPRRGWRRATRTRRTPWGWWRRALACRCWGADDDGWLVLVVGKCVEEDGNKNVHDDVAADDEQRHKEEGHRLPAHLHRWAQGIDPRTRHDDEARRDRREEVIEVIARLLLERVVLALAARARYGGVACRRIVPAAQDLHPDQSENLDGNGHEHEDVAQLRQHLAKGDDDLVQPFPRLHQAEYSHHA